MDPAEEAEVLAFSRDVMRRVHARMRSGVVESAPVLPRSKDEFPKVLCLDLNKWVDLARAHHGRKGGEAFRDALEAVRAATARRRLVVPILGSNAMEAGEAYEVARRRRLAAAMVDISGNISCMSPPVTNEWELRYAVMQLASPTPTIECIRSRLLYRGVYPAINGHEAACTAGSEAANQLLAESMKEPEYSVHFLVHGLSRETIADARKLDERGRQRLEAIRIVDQSLAPEVKRRLESENTFRSPKRAAMIRAAWVAAGGKGDEAEALLGDSDRLVDLAARVPSFDIVTELMLARDRDRTARGEANDNKDLSFLKQAIAYANIVVTEKRWVHHARARGLHVRYSTRMLADTAQLPKILTELGCLR